MSSYVWLFFIVALLAAEPRASAQDIKKGEVRRCHRCLSANETSNCGPAVECPTERPYCATVATAPNFAQSLTCATASREPCSLTVKTNEAFELTCICTGHLCNALYSTKLRNELLNFVTKLSNNTNSELTAEFLNSSVFLNVTKAQLYKALTVRDIIRAESQPLPTESIDVEIPAELLPRAEALRHAATVPPDDDEDDGEGSGTFIVHKSSQLPVTPDAPSSFFLPEQNRAPVHARHVLSLVIIFLHVPHMF